MLPHSRIAALTGAIVILLGCERADEPPAQNPPPAASSGGVELIAGTPAGDLEEWIDDVQAGLESVRARQVRPAEVHPRVLDLYVSRQEYIEMYYGPGGRLEPTPQLAEAIKLAETRFHEVMRLTGSTPPAEASVVTKAIDDLKAQYRVVLEEAKQTPKRLRESAGKAP